ADTALVADVARGDAAGRRHAATRAAELLPHMHDIHFYSPSLDEVLTADFQQFGYAKAARLMELQSHHEAPQVGVVGRGKQHFLALALPITATGPDALAYVWLEWSIKPLLQQLMQVDPGEGRLALRQGKGPHGLILATHGRHPGVTSGAAGEQIPGSQLWVTAAMPRAFIVLPRHWILAAVLALVALIGAGVLLRPRFQRKKIHQEEEIPVSRPTSAEVPGNTSAPAPAPAPAPTPAVATVDVDPGIFRAYDIRGVVGKQLTAEVAHALGQAIGSEMREQGLSEIVVGRDGRLSGPELAGALADGLRASGIDVIDVG